MMALTAFGGFFISIFTVLRFIQAKWLLGFVDLFISVGMFAIFAYVYKTRNVKMPSIVLAVFSAIAAMSSVYIKGVDNVYWIYPALVAVYYLVSPRLAVILTSILILLLIPIIYSGAEFLVFVSILSTAIMTSIFGFFFSLSVRQQHQRLKTLATKDSLTGINNRRALDEKLANIILSQKRKPSTVSLILLDLDHFKRINDAHGHIVGDQVLVQIAAIIEGRIRITDTLYRFGGEEFVIVPLELDLELAERLAEQLRVLVENNALVPENPVTISLGVAEYQKGETCDQWLNRADKALYRAKDTGRNRVCVADN